MQINKAATTLSMVKTALVSVLRQEQNFSVDPSSIVNNNDDISNLRSILGDILIASNHHWKESTLELIDEVWKEEAQQIERVPVAQLPGRSYVNNNNKKEKHGTNTTEVNSTTTRIVLWQGDITRLHGENLAIVNAANDQGLGCFSPSHKCIDNVIHRAAGPRLRMECNHEMQERGYPLLTGTDPLITSAYHLPSSYIIHTTGPQVKKRGKATDEDRANLAKSYKLALDKAMSSENHNIKAVAFPCISTGLFGFPPDEAADIALRTVREWIDENENENADSSNNKSLDTIVFNVYAPNDMKLYNERIDKYFPVVDDMSTASIISSDREWDQNTLDKNEKMTWSVRDKSIQLAKKWIDDADAVLICAGAGMSVKEGEMVYTNPKDFAKHYPWFPKWGYRTNYEVMGLGNDMSVPMTAKWALYAKHMDNMRWKFTPNTGYTDLLALVQEKDYFVLTSNVDGCFERSGFDPNKIYTPQGEWTYVQCRNKCRHDSVYPSRPYLDQLVPHISTDGYIPKEMIPKCPRCGGDMFGNVRAGGWFIHAMYEEQNKVIQNWMQTKIDDGSKVVVIEIGAGFNTPTVTRFPMESFVRELSTNRHHEDGSRGRMIRINPSDPDVPEDLHAIAFDEGWQILNEIRTANDNENVNVNANEIESSIRDPEKLIDTKITNHYKTRYFGHFDWRVFLGQLREKSFGLKLELRS